MQRSKHNNLFVLLLLQLSSEMLAQNGAKIFRNRNIRCVHILHCIYGTLHLHISSIVHISLYVHISNIANMGHKICTFVTTTWTRQASCLFHGF